mgnify:CR=1 FL=1
MILFQLSSEICLIRLDKVKDAYAKSDCIIGVEHVSKFFGDKAVLNDVNLSVRKGEFVTILGPSGCGKTTPCAWWQAWRSPRKGICIWGTGRLSMRLKSFMRNRENAILTWYSSRMPFGPL